MLLNYEHKRHNCQQNIPLYTQLVVSQCELMAPHYRKIANYLFSLSNSCGKVFTGRRYLAREVGVSERTISRAFLLFEKIGLLTRVSRPGHSNLFEFNPLLADDRVRSALRPFFKAMKTIPIALNLLLSPLKAKSRELLSNSIVSSILILKEDIYIKRNETKPTGGRIRAYERAREAFSGVVFEKENKMNEFKREGSLIPDSVKKSGLHLTPIGEADLARYPDEAIKFALEQLALAADVSDPFRYVCKIANTWCKQKGIHPDHVFSGKHFELLKADITSPRLVDSDLSDLITLKPKPVKQGYTTPRKESDVYKLHPEFKPKKAKSDCCLFHINELDNLHKIHKRLDPVYASFLGNDDSLGSKERATTIENCGGEESAVIKKNREIVERLIMKEEHAEF